MKLGLGLPNTLVGVDRALMLEWARLADAVGFHALATIDKPNYDAWDPLATLAAVAAVTERARLFPTILQLPNRNEVVVAKQAAVIDQLSNGRLDLGVAAGGRVDDFEVLDASFAGRGPRLARQVRRMREIWSKAAESDREHGVLGPPPVQRPGPPIWFGGSHERAVARALRLGDGFVIGTAGVEGMRRRVPQLRALAAARGKAELPIAGLAYVAVGDDPQAALAEGAHHVLRYYGRLWTEPGKLIHHGPPSVIAEAVRAYAETGLDLLILFPQIPRLDQVERLARDVLPAWG